MAIGLLARGLQAGLGGLRAARGAATPLLSRTGSALASGTGSLLRGASNQASRFGKGFSQQARRSQPGANLGRNYTGASATAGRMAQPLTAGGARVLKAAADDITKIAQSVLQGAGKTNTAANAAAVQKAILQKYPGAGEVAASLAARIKSGTTSLKGLDIAGALRSSPAFLQSIKASATSGIQTLATSPMAQKVAGSRIGQGTKNLFNRANIATNPAVANPAADAAFGSVMAQGRNIGSQIGSGIGNQFNRVRSGIGSFVNPNQMSAFGSRLTTGGRNAAGGAYAQPGLMSQMRGGLGGLRNRFSRTPTVSATTPKGPTGNPFNLPDIPPASLPTLGGTLRATGRGLKGVGSFMKNYPKTSLVGGTLGVMYGPDAYDAATTAMFGKSPEQQFRQGVGSLMGTEENRRRTLGDLGALYAQGELGEAIGTPGARNLSQQQMRQYLGGSIFGDEGYANIPMRGGTGVFGGEGSPTMAGDIFNNPARESIMRQFGTQMNDEEIMEKYAEILDKQRKKESLDAEDLQFLMMFEALTKPTNLPTDQFRRNAGFESSRARQDVQNQLGGQFEVIDYNELYPTYAQPQTAINAAMGGEASGPGTGTSDSIPAMLSDGEFVMTAEAVRNAGDGDRKKGVRKMYALMNSLEGK